MRRRSAKPRVAAPELGRNYVAAGRATSHNGARYAFVRSKTPSHVALSGAPPRCLQAEKSGSGCRHTCRPSGNPAGWNRKRSVPLALLSASPVLWIVRGAPQIATRHARAASRWSALAGEPPASRPVPLCRPLQASGGRSVIRPARPSSASSGRHSPLPPNSCHEKCGDIFRASPNARGRHHAGKAVMLPAVAR